jgi:hypothetical protein
VLNVTSPAPTSSIVGNATEDAGNLILAENFDIASCKPGTTPETQRVDLSKMDEEFCIINLY